MKEIDKRLANIEALLLRLCVAVEARGLGGSLPLPSGMTEAQNEAAYVSAIEQTVEGDREAIVRFLKSGGKVPSGKSFWPQTQSRTSRPSGSRNRKYRGD